MLVGQQGLRNTSVGYLHLQLIRAKFLQSEAAKVSSSVNLFPWTSVSPESRHPLRRLYQMFRQNMTRHTLRDLIFHDIIQNIAVDSIAIGTCEAMHCVSMSIFRHKRMKDNYIDISSKYKKADEVILQEMQDESSDVDMATIFDKKLEDFYLYAIQSHCLNADRLCTYSLKSVTAARIVNIAYYVSARRDTTTPPYSYLSSNFDVNIFIDESHIDSSNLQSLYKAYPKVEALCVEQLDSLQDSTVRVTVDVDCTGKIFLPCFIPCVTILHHSFSIKFLHICICTTITEVFAITNAVSGDVLQGSLEPQMVTHQVRMYKCILSHKTGTFRKHLLLSITTSVHFSTNCIGIAKKTTKLQYFSRPLHP